MTNFAHSLIAAGKRFSKDENGNDAVEYGLILGLISLVIVGSAQAMGVSLTTLYTNASGALAGAVAG